VAGPILEEVLKSLPAKDALCLPAFPRDAPGQLQRYVGAVARQPGGRT